MCRFTIYFYGAPLTTEYKRDEQVFTHGETVVYADDEKAAMKKFRSMNFGDMRARITKIE